MSKIHETFVNTFLAIITTLVTFAILEAAANIYLLHFADEKHFIRYASLKQLQNSDISNHPRYSPHRYIGFYPTPNYIKGKDRHNSLGYRGDEIDIPKPAGQFRIVCLGGSTTYTADVKDYRNSYPYLLEIFLNTKGYDDVTVVNAGGGSWSSWESLINFQLRVLDLEPDLVIVYHGINDISPRFVWPPEAYRGDNSGARAPNQTGIFMPSIFEYSTLLRIAMISTGLINSHASFESTIDRRPDTYYGTLFNKQKTSGVYPEGIFEEVSAADILKTNKADYFERNIQSIVAIAKSRGIDVVLSSFAYSPLFTDQPKVASDEYIAAYKENNRLLKAMANDTNQHFFDFAEKFPTEKRWYTDGRHVNEAGALLKAELFGDFLIDAQLLPPRSP
ncbi:MAG: SGNH/GDSL hydrolase family protein [Gammaproteobacteria bacterium]|nr:SGNH/GDSL hydrolase family protein [Gammaproteobacteria bacterium]